MLPTGIQLMAGMRSGKVRRNSAPAFDGAPLRRAVVYKIAIMSPRKPNSARRTFAKVRVLSITSVYLQKYQVLVSIFYKHILLLWLEDTVLKIHLVLL